MNVTEAQVNEDMNFLFKSNIIKFLVSPINFWIASNDIPTRGAD